MKLESNMYTLSRAIWAFNSGLLGIQRNVEYNHIIWLCIVGVVLIALLSVFAIGFWIKIMNDCDTRKNGFIWGWTIAEIVKIVTIEGERLRAMR